MNERERETERVKFIAEIKNKIKTYLLVFSVEIFKNRGVIYL